MKNNPKTTPELQAENTELRARLAEAEEVLQAIGTGAVDAVVVSGPQGDQVFTLKGAEHAYRVLVEAMNEGAATLSRDGVILYANASLARMLKKPLEKIIGTPMRRYVAPEDAARFDAMLLQGAQISNRGELILKADDATRLPALMFISNLVVEEAQALCLVVTDLTEQKRATEEIARLASFPQLNPNPVLEVDNAGNITFTNSAAQEIVQKLALQDVKSFLPADLREILKATGEKGERQFYREVEIKGTVLAAHIYFVPQFQVTRLFLLDITDHKRAEAEVKLNEARLASLLRISQYSSTSIQELLDYALDEAIALTASRIGYIYFYDEATQQFTLNTWSKDVMQQCAVADPQTIYQLGETGIWGEAVRQAGPIVVNDFQKPHPLKKGHPPGHAPIYKYLTVPVFSDGHIVAVAAVANKPTDYDPADVKQLTLMMEVVWKIVERYRAVEDLQRNEEKYRSIVETAQEGIWVTDAELRTSYVNQRLAELLGYPEHEMIGCSLFDFMDDVGREDMQKKLARRRQGIQETYDFRFKRQDSSDLWAIVAAAPYLDSQGNFIGSLGMITDITDRKLAEQGLIDAAAKWRTTFDSIGDAMSLLDREHRILQCNQAMADLVGKPVSEIVGRKCWEMVHGATGPIEGCPIARMRGSRRRETLTLQRGDRWLQMTVDPVLNESGEVTGGVHIITDITQRQRDVDQIRNLNALLKAIKDINEAVLLVKSEPELFKQICNLTIKIPYVRFAWIGLVQPDSFEVQPVAWAGHEDGYLSGIKVTWDDSPQGRGPIATAIKTGKPGTVEDIENDPEFRPWRQKALQRGYASCIAFPLIHAGITLGTLTVYAEKINAFGSEEIEFLYQVASDIAVGVRSLRIEQELIQSLIKMEVLLLQTIGAIASMAELRDPYTAGHQRRVTRLALALAQETGLPPDRIEGLRVASLIHDIGKMVVPSEILNKPGKLSDNEMEIIRAHPQASYDILAEINFPWPVAQIALQHHERLNGSGYPQGLQGSDILQEAKILAVADVVEAMSSHRPYRPGLGIDQALEEISRNKGVLYDPAIVDICVKLFTEKGFQLEP